MRAKQDEDLRGACEHELLVQHQYNYFYEEFSYVLGSSAQRRLTCLPYVVGSAAAPFANACGVEDNSCASERLLATGESHSYRWANDDMRGMKEA